MIFTFYSYKGGVGRSMALSGVAHILAKQNLKVLVIDFDLEAPGLERYFFDSDGCRSIRTHPGLMDLIQSYRRALSDEAAFEKAEFKQLNRFILNAINVAGTKGGSVDLMTAGQREPQQKLHEYSLAVRSFDWQDFYHNWKGDLFFDWLRRQLIDPGTGYDVVLVDSRTGVTEMGGVCAYQLADAAILLCAPNYQNLEGTRDVVLDFRSDGVQALRQGRPLEILAIPARLAEDHPKADEFLTAFERELSVDGIPNILANQGFTYRKLALPYLKEFAVEERLVGESSSQATETVIKSFETLADAMILLAKPDSVLANRQSEALARIHGNAPDDRVDLVADNTRSTAGYDVYIDYGRRDEGMGRELRSALESAGFRVLCVDAETILPGTEWSSTMDTAFRETENLLICFGQDTSSPFRETLLKKAREANRVRIIPILLPGDDATSALRSLALDQQKALDLSLWTDPDSKQLENLILTLKTRSHAKEKQAPTQPDRDPYPGAKAYCQDDAGFFFGREIAVESTVEALKENKVVLLQGPTNVGKTSLAQAGVLPNWSKHYTEGHNSNFTSSFSLENYLGDGAFALKNAVAEFNSLLTGSGQNSHGLIILDDLDSFCQDTAMATRASRIGTVLDLLDTSSDSIHFLLIWRGTLPEDERQPALAAFSGYTFATINMEPLSGDDLRRAIEEPAKRAGHLLEPGLAERLVESAGNAKSAIQQIQLALAAIWPERRRGWLTNKSLDAAGHLNGIFARHIESILSKLDDAERDAAHVLFKNLSQLNANLDLVSQNQAWSWSETIPALQNIDAYRLREQLAAHGLIDLWYEAANNLHTAGVTLALTRLNPLTYMGVDVVPDSAFFMWRGQFITYVNHWLNAQKHADALITGYALNEAEYWLNLKYDQLTEPERSLVLVSVKAREEAQAEAQQKEREEIQRRVKEEFAQLAAETRKQAERERKKINEIDNVKLELLRLGPAHNQILSPLTPYIAVCGADGPVTVLLPFVHRQLLMRLSHMRYPKGKDPAIDEQRQGEVRDIGDTIGHIFGQVPALLTELSNACNENGKLIHLCLTLSGFELGMIPFEAAIAPDGSPGSGSPLFLQIRTPISITREIRRGQPLPVEWNRPPRILFAYAEPNGLNVPAQTYFQALCEAIEPWIQIVDNDRDRFPEFKKILTIIPNASFEKIRRECATTEYTHVHILAHGAPFTNSGEELCGIALCNEIDQTIDIVNGERLAIALTTRDSSGVARYRPTIVTLATCDSGNIDTVITPGGSIAHELNAAGIPWVIASQFPLWMKASAIAAEVLYRGLLNGKDPRWVLYELRQRLHTDFPDTQDWASIVAYSTVPWDFEEQVNSFRDNQTRRKLEVKFTRIDELVEIYITNNKAADAEAPVALVQDKIAELKYLCDSIRADLKKWRAELDSFASPQLQAERLGVSAYSEKRIGISLALANDCTNSKLAYEASRDFYLNALEIQPSYHWAITQHLSVLAILSTIDNSIKAEVLQKEYGKSWLVAYQIAEWQCHKAEPEDQAWALASLAELALLGSIYGGATNYDHKQAKAEINRCCKEIRELMGSDSFIIFSTKRQFRRYISCWKRTEWNDLAREAIKALGDKTL